MARFAPLMGEDPAPYLQKAQAIREAFCGPVTPKVPASILQLHPDFILVADEDALSLVGTAL